MNQIWKYLFINCLSRSCQMIENVRVCWFVELYESLICLDNIESVGDARFVYQYKLCINFCFYVDLMWYVEFYRTRWKLQTRKCKIYNCCTLQSHFKTLSFQSTIIRIIELSYFLWRLLVYVLESLWRMLSRCMNIKAVAWVLKPRQECYSRGTSAKTLVRV